MSADSAGVDISARFPDLDGKVAIVTGTTRGMGCGIAYVLGKQGMKVMLTGLPGEDGEAFFTKLAAAGVECHWAAADLSTPEGAQAVFDAAVERFERIDLLVNNACYLRSSNFLDLDEELFHNSCERNIRIVYGISFLVAHHMADAGGGCIVNISSVGGLRAHHSNCGYDAGKGAVDSFTRTMAIDLAPRGIRVNGVGPGAINSHPDQGNRRESYKKRSRGLIPLDRLGENEDIGAAVAFLASDAASYITGQTLYVDGGLTAQLHPPRGYTHPDR